MSSVEDTTSKFIGEGTFGCVHKPPMECNSNKRRNKNDISKLMTSINAIKELKEFAFIKSADKEKEFYLGKPNECKPARILSNIRSISSCPSGNFNALRMDDYSLLVMKYGGQDLSIFGDEVQTWTKTKANVDAIELFWLEVVRLFYGLNVLHDNDILHHDLKPQNIVYDRAANRVNFIDFGFMEKKSTRISQAKRSNSWLGDKHHWSFPLEAVYWNKNRYIYAATKGKSEKAYDEFADSVAYNCGHFFISVFRPDINTSDMDKLVNISTKGAFKNVLEFEPTNDAYNRFIDKSIDTVDTYGLGIALMFVLHRSVHLLDNDFAHKLGKIVGTNMLHPRLFRRSTPEQLLANYEDVLTNSGLLEKHNKHIENHLIANKVSAEMKVADAIDNSTTKFKIQPAETTEIVRDCPAGKEFNPLTKRCVNVCAPGKVRNPASKCVRDKPESNTIKDCPEGKERNTHTKRCVNVCKPGSVRNSSFRCVRDKSHYSKTRRNCPGGKELNPATKRCVNFCKPGHVRNASFKCVRGKSGSKTRKIHQSVSPIIANASIHNIDMPSLP